MDTQPEFKAFDEQKPLSIYRRNLPHWRQEGATYFVTFRLGDSIPRSVVRDWQCEDALWLKANGIGGPLSDPKWRDEYDALSDAARATYERKHARRMHVELDKCHGSCLLRSKDVREVLANALVHFHGVRWWVGDFVIIPNHVHGLFMPTGKYALERILQSVKSYVTTRLHKAGIGSATARIWQQESYDRLVRSREELARWRRYIQANPAKAALRDEDYTYHRCAWLDEE